MQGLLGVSLAGRGVSRQAAPTLLDQLQACSLFLGFFFLTLQFLLCCHLLLKSLFTVRILLQVDISVPVLLAIVDPRALEPVDLVLGALNLVDPLALLHQSLLVRHRRRLAGGRAPVESARGEACVSHEICPTAS